jgi:hypothetical protein
MELAKPNKLGGAKNKVPFEDIPPSYSNQEYIRTKVDAHVRSFECTGYGYIMLGMVVNAPWIAFIYTLSSEIEYKPS